MKTLLFGIGNSGRQDDGLGWAFAEAMEREGLASMEIHYRYQMQVEDAELVAGAEKVLFVDASRGVLRGGYLWKKIKPSAKFEFTTHILQPESVLFLAQDLFGKTPQAWRLLIEGEQWELESGLSDRAKLNLKKALEFLIGELVKSRI